MGDIWNPFDNNNPVYVKLAKEMGARRYRVKSGFLILAGVVFITAYSQRNLLGIGGRVNQFGVVRRK
jgi:hypothetical protein